MITLVSSTFTECRCCVRCRKPAQRLQVEHVALIRAQHEPDIRHHEEHRQAEERSRALRHRGMRKDKRREVRAQNSEDRAHRRADQPAQAGLSQAHLEEYDRQTEETPNDSAKDRRNTKRAKMKACTNTHRHENDTNSEHVPNSPNPIETGTRRSSRFQCCSFGSWEWLVACYAVQEESSAWSHLMKICIRRIASNDFVSQFFPGVIKFGRLAGRR